MANQLLVNAVPQIDILMLGWLAGPGEVGVYHAASRGALLITLVFGAMNGAAARRPSRASGVRVIWPTSRSRRQLLRAHHVSVAVLLGAALVLGAKDFLGLFGPEFVRGELSLMILVAGWLGVVACGLVQSF